jgi:hypothetical protein
MTLLALRLGLLLFWSLWLTIVFLTNACEGLKLLGWLPERWKFASRNIEEIQEAITVYSPPGWLPGLLFAGVIAWQAVAAALMWRAAFTYAHDGTSAALPAFAASLGLFAAFMLADEACKAYNHQSSHLLIFIAQLVTLLALITAS